MKIVATNKKAYHEYFIEDTYEAGIELYGAEVKSVRLQNINLKDSYAFVRGGEVFVSGMHIAPYKMGSYYNPQDSKRERRLLLHKKEILKIAASVQRDGYTLIATKVYFDRALIKVELAVCKGKQLHDKRRALKEKEAKREADRAVKEAR